MNNDDYDDVRWDDYSTEAFIPPTTYNSPIMTYGDSITDDTGFQPDLYTTPDLQQGNEETMSYNNNLGSSQDPASLPHHDTEDTPKEMTVRVDDPQKYEASYMTYLVTTMTLVETFTSQYPKPVRRRFQDFIWLHRTLCLEFPACVIPQPPEKHRLKYIKGDRFNKDFIERRRLGLEWFLNRIARHPLLQASQCTRVFLESGDFKNDKQMQSKRFSPHSSFFSVLSGTFLKPFTQVKKPEDRFISMKESLDKFEDNLTIVERLYTRLGRRQQELEHDYLEFSGGIRGLSVLEPSVERKLRQFAEVVEQYAGCIADLTRNEETRYLNNLHEQLAYCRATKVQLQVRDNKQVIFEELSTHLQRLIQDRERLTHQPSLGDYVVDKMGEIRGNSLTQTRRERMTRLQAKQEELEHDVSVATDTNNFYSNQMIKEYGTYQKTRVVELKQGLAAYADCRVAFYQEGIDLWTKVLPILETMNISNSD